MQGLSQGEIAHYRRHGYVVARGCLPTDKVTDIRGLILSLYEQSFENVPTELTSPGSDALDLSAYFQDKFRIDQQRFWNTSRVAQEIVEVVALGASSVPLAALRSLGLQTPAYALRPQLIWASNWMESAGAHSLRPLHQDWERLGGSLDSVVGWMPLTPVREGGFPLLVSPGSHRWGVLPHAVYRAGIQIADESAKRDVELKTIEADPGDLVLFSSLLVHSSGEGEADRLRMALSYRYNNLSDRSYIARGFPSGFKLTPVENPAPEDLPTAEDVAEVFGPA